MSLHVYGDFEKDCQSRNAAIDRLATGYQSRGLSPHAATAKAARVVAQRSHHVIVPGVDVNPSGPTFGVMGRVVASQRPGGPRHAG
jgi:hypothetical protein